MLLPKVNIQCFFAAMYFGKMISFQSNLSIFILIQNYLLPNHVKNKSNQQLKAFNVKAAFILHLTFHPLGLSPRGPQEDARMQAR